MPQRKCVRGNWQCKHPAQETQLMMARGAHGMSYVACNICPTGAADVNEAVKKWRSWSPFCSHCGGDHSCSQAFGSLFVVHVVPLPATC